MGIFWVLTFVLTAEDKVETKQADRKGKMGAKSQTTRKDGRKW